MKRTRTHGALAALFVLFVAGGTGAAGAMELLFPGPATVTARSVDQLASYALPTGPFDGEVVPVRPSEGAVERSAFRIDLPGVSTLHLMSHLRGQLARAGYRTIFDCETEACGGFDFRYASDLFPEPEMHVDLGDFRYLAAERGNEVLALMVSRSAMAGFAQVTRVTPGGGPAPVLLAADTGSAREVALSADSVSTLAGDAGPVVALSGSNAPGPGLSTAAALDAHGLAVLEDLEFASGSTALLEGDYPSLADLADWLRRNPGRKVALVGHTDASGGLETNIVISRRRADSVRAVLQGIHRVPSAQVMAEGVGYLAPRASNATEEGRRANRRVEVVVTDP
ncbi:MAG: OmpA family protein [Gemmobacter sp.]